jgi:hypothetical protein
MLRSVHVRPNHQRTSKQFLLFKERLERLRRSAEINMSECRIILCAVPFFAFLRHAVGGDEAAEFDAEAEKSYRLGWIGATSGNPCALRFRSSILIRRCLRVARPPNGGIPRRRGAGSFTNAWGIFSFGCIWRQACLVRHLSCCVVSSCGRERYHGSCGATARGPVLPLLLTPREGEVRHQPVQYSIEPPMGDHGIGHWSR